MTKEYAHDLLRYLKAVKMPFCYDKNGRMVTIGEAYKALGYTWDDERGWIMTNN